MTSRQPHIAALSSEPRRITLHIDGVEVVAQRHHLSGYSPWSWGLPSSSGVGTFIMLRRAEARQVLCWQTVRERANHIARYPRSRWTGSAPVLPPAPVRPAPFEGQAQFLPVRARRGGLDFELAAY